MKGDMYHRRGRESAREKNEQNPITRDDSADMHYQTHDFSWRLKTVRKSKKMLGIIFLMGNREEQVNKKGEFFLTASSQETIPDSHTLTGQTSILLA
jgi:hypothetical protein